MSVLAAIYDTLTEDTTLMAALPGGISTLWTDSTTLPRAVLNYTTSRLDQNLHTGTLSVDIFVDGHQIAVAEGIAELIVDALEDPVMEEGRAGAIRAYHLSQGLVQEESPEYGHLSMVFELRFARLTEA